MTILPILTFTVIDKHFRKPKDQMIRSRPTSSSSNFMYINPLLGVNQRHNNNFKFQPLEEGIPEENWKGKTKKATKANKRKVKKNKRKVIRCKPSDAGDNDNSSNKYPELSVEERHGKLYLTLIPIDDHPKAKKEQEAQQPLEPPRTFRTSSRPQYNDLRYDEADSKSEQKLNTFIDSVSGQSDNSENERMNGMLIPIYKGKFRR